MSELRRRLLRQCALPLLFSLCCLPAFSPAEAQEDAASPSGEPDDQSEILIIGIRGSAIKDVAPIAELDANAIAATGASTMGELLQSIQGQTKSADGSDPIFLLNAQRVSGYQEIGSLPPEAIDKVEVLPEQAAIRFGFPPTRRVVNFITKRRFRQAEAKVGAGTTLPWGSATETANLSLTRLHDDARLTANLEYRRTDPLFHSDRKLVPDPDIPFDAIGNVTAPDGGDIDPALSATAGAPVSIVPVPEDASSRGDLVAYALGANRPRLFPLGRFATLSPGNDTLKAEAVVADRIGATLAGSLSLSAEQSRDRSLGGPAPARLLVPEANPFSPFGAPVILNRYLVEADPLLQREKTTALHAGGTLRGAIAGWQWDFTAAFDQKQIDGLGERGIDLTAANAAIAAGADPFAPLDPALLTSRLIDDTRVRTRSLEAKAVATNRPLRLPAGPVTFTGTIEAGRASAASSLRGSNTSELKLGRSRIEAAMAIDVPLTSRDRKFLSFIGDLSLNASVNVRRVGGFGSLHDSTLGLAWAPFEALQFLATVKHSAGAPDMVQQSTPVREVADAAIFDFRSGRTELVTLISGGNPDLRAERRDVRSLTANIKPFPKSELRLSATFEDTDIRDQTGTVVSISPQTEELLPDLVSRDAEGRLLSVTFRPTNFYRERQQALQFTLNASGKIGRTPPSAESKGEAKPQVGYYGGIGPTFKLRDRLQLREGTRVLDLLNGDSIGTWTPAVYAYAYGGLNYRGFGATINGWYGGPRHIRSDDPASDIYFSSIFKLKLGAYMPVEALFRHQSWAHKLQLRVDAENITDSRQRVRDGNGLVPNRYQTDYIDPIGRTLTVTMRKRF